MKEKLLATDLRNILKIMVVGRNLRVGWSPNIFEFEGVAEEEFMGVNWNQTGYEESVV